MKFLPKSHHKKLFDDCYPPPKALDATAPEYRPNSNELSRLCYYALNKPAKLAKVGALLIARSAQDSRAISGSSNLRPKAGLMLTLSILQELADTSSEGHSYLAQPVLNVLTDTFRAAAPDSGSGGWEFDLITRATAMFVTYVSGLPAEVLDVDANVQRAVASGIEDMRLISGLRVEERVIPATDYTRLVALYGLDGMIRAPALYTSQYCHIIPRAIPVLLLNLSPLYVTLKTAQHAAASTAPTASPIPFPTVGTEPTIEQLAQISATLLRHAVQGASFAQLRAITSAVIDFVSEANLWNESTWVAWLLTQILRWGQSMSRYVVPLTCVDTMSSSDSRQGPVLMVAVRAMLSSETSLAGLNMRELLDKYTTVLLERVQRNPSDPAITPIIQTIGSFGTGAGGDQAGVIVRDIHLTLAALQKGTGRYSELTPIQRNNSIRALLYALVSIVRTRSTEERTRLSLSSWEPSIVVLTSSDAAVRYTYLSALEVFITVELGSGNLNDVMRTLHKYAAAIFVLLSAGITSAATTAADIQCLSGVRKTEPLVSVPSDFVGAAATLDELYERMPVAAVMATIPPLIALDRLVMDGTHSATDFGIVQRRAACRQLFGHVLAKLGAVSNSRDIVNYADARIRNFVGDLRLSAPQLPAEFGPAQPLSDFAALNAELGPACEDVNEIAELIAAVPQLQNSVPGGQSVQTWVLREWSVAKAFGEAHPGAAQVQRPASVAQIRPGGAHARGFSISSARTAPRSTLQRDPSISVGQLRSVLLGRQGNTTVGGLPSSATTTSIPGHLADQSFDTLGTDARSTATVRVRRRARSIHGEDILSRHRSVISMLDRYGTADSVEPTAAAV
ncbi:plasma membrane localization protein [Malassezia cuniculi]|uniref:Plasma membrane localization protein n=1 Tax=Malassezia cuniculi TaxID=948313 RepID=A0AAF0ETD0_9BASI|nr:plasma membrane localization protein [Malassezia cuniculi]